MNVHSISVLQAKDVPATTNDSFKYKNISTADKGTEYKFKTSTSSIISIIYCGKNGNTPEFLLILLIYVTDLIYEANKSYKSEWITYVMEEDRFDRTDRTIFINQIKWTKQTWMFSIANWLSRKCWNVQSLFVRFITGMRMHRMNMNNK